MWKKKFKFVQYMIIILLFNSKNMFSQYKIRPKLDIVIFNKPIIYPQAMALMEKKVMSIIGNQCHQALWFLEHYPVYTGGRIANCEDISQETRLSYYRTARGGQVTFHGPGQIVIYAMLNLKSIFFDGINIRMYIKMLYQWISLVLRDFNFNVVSDKNIGVWIMDNEVQSKIASIGLKIKHSVSYHGIALNASTDLRYFYSIVPCGLKNLYITSIKKQKKTCVINFHNIVHLLMKKFCYIFNYELSAYYYIG